MKLKGRGLLSLSLSRKPVVYVILALLIFGAFFSTLFFVPPAKIAHAAGTTYYVRADGTVTCANKATATSPSNANTSLNMAQVNACTFVAGDQVQFSSQGGDYAVALSLPSSGTVGNQITYANVPTETPKISTAAPTNGIIIDTHAKSNVVVRGFSVLYTGSTAETKGIDIGAGTNINVTSCIINMGGYGYGILSSSTVTTVLIDSCAISNNAASTSEIYLLGVASSGITISNCTTGAGKFGIEVRNASNVTISNIPSTTGVRLQSVTTANISSVTASSSLGSSRRALDLKNCSGITVDDFSYSGNDYGYYIEGTTTNVTINRLHVSGGALSCTIDDTANNITINDSTATNSRGFTEMTGAHDITYNRVVADSNTDNGFAPLNNVYNVTYNNCISKYNGTVDQTANGGGFIPHNAATNIRVYNSLAYGNYNEGIGDVSAGVNIYENNVSWDNGYAVGDSFRGSTVTTPSNRSGIYLSNVSSSSIFENNIIGGGKPGEIMIIGAGRPTFNYNLYYPTNNSNFISYGFPANFTSWATYHATNEPHSLNADPQFVSTVTPDFHLQSTSPAIDAGVDLNINTDYDGKQRYDMPGVANTGSAGAFSKNYVDIGAYEYVTPPNPVLHSTACPDESAWCADATPDISLSSNTSPTTHYHYLVNQTLAPLEAAVEAGTLDADGSFNVPGGVINANGTWYVHLIAQNLDNDSSANYDTYTIKYGMPGSNPAIPVINSVNLTEDQVVHGTYRIEVGTSIIKGSIQKVEFYIDNVLVYTDYTKPYYYDWDTTKYQNGLHTIKIIVYSTNGNKTETSYNVLVMNELPGNNINELPYTGI